MRWSNLFVPTLRDAPNDAVAPSHALLIRAGFIRQLHAGHYSMLPLGWRSHQKVAQIVREEVEAIGGQEFLLPTMHPAEIWQQSGRWDTMGEIMFRLDDRRGNPTALGITHEEIFATVATELSSYKQLPQIWYQIQTKFRDEARPKSGLLRVREFHMKDSYSFDIDQAGLDAAFDAHDAAYRRIFARLGVPSFGVEASSGAMGGNDSIEFMTPSDAGEDDVIRCGSCGYAANIERATSTLPAIEDPVPADAPEKFATPGVLTIAALEAFDGGAAADRQLKTLVMVLDGQITLVVVRGDHQLNTQKLIDATGAIEVRPAERDETFAALGANPGSLGAVGVTDLPVIADLALEGRTSMTTGANDDGFHFRDVDVARDLTVGQWADLREVSAGEACPNCGTDLEVVRCIEIGHIFKLGTKYAEAFGASVSTPDGEVPIVMGSYGIGIGRNLAAAVEANHDENGIVWPVEVAPFEVVITAMRLDEATLGPAETLYTELKAAGVDALLDDRDARAGVKFADAELVGFPIRLTVGPRGLENGIVEMVERASGDKSEVALADVVATVTSRLAALRATMPG